MSDQDSRLKSPVLNAAKKTQFRSNLEAIDQFFAEIALGTKDKRHQRNIKQFVNSVKYCLDI